MVPWYWFWAPQVHFPLSGDVAQRIDPVAIQRLFFQGIPTDAGDARIEEAAATRVASYGTQLGWLSDAVLAALDPESGLTKDEATQALKRLRDARREIEQLKGEVRATRADAILADLRRMKARDEPAFEAMKPALRALLGPA